MEPAAAISNKWSSQLYAKGSENELMLERDAWKKIPWLENLT